MIDTRPRQLIRSLAALAVVATIATACAGASGQPSTPARTGPSAGAGTAVVHTPAVTVATAAATRAVSATSSTTRSAPPTAAPAPPVTAQPSPAALTTTATPTIAQMVGQKLVVKMDSAVPSASLLGRIRRGEVGGVILFGEDISSTSQLKALTAQLHAAAAAGGQPRLLVMTDQEGGLIRRIPWAPPTMSAKAMGTDGRTSTARNQGFLTGQALKSLGVDVDLAPVGDVPISTSSFMWLANRTFGFTPSVVSPLSNAFALGLRDGGTVATMKHFPGIGRALKNTDSSTVTIAAPLTWLQGRDLVPYRTAILNRIPMIMLSNANYPALDPTWGAGWSRAIGINLLRTQMGFKGVTITDSLTAAANTRGLTSAFLAMEAAANGTDMELLTGSEASTSSVFNYMVKKAEAGAIGTPTLTNSYRRIIALKAGL